MMNLAHRYLSLLGLILIISFSSGCSEEPVTTALLPSNLVFTIEESETTEGLVTFKADAVNANFYSFVFEDEGETKFIESQSGEENYQFSVSGIYDISARAHATHDEYTSTDASITIDFSEPDTIDYGNPPTSGYESPLSYEGYTLVWQDEFDGTSLSSDWTHNIGRGSSGWGNNELQYYRAENTTVSGGNLIIEAREEQFNGANYTSSRIVSQGKQSFKYGRIDVRAAMPYGQGIWPAIWMLGDAFTTSGWPSCGEIDIMEMVGGNVSGGGDDVTHGTVHWDNNGQYASFTGSKKSSTGKLADNFHVYSIVWTEQKIEWRFDNVVFHTIDITPAHLSEFKENFFFILNVAVGGNWPGSPNASTIFPQKMYVDYVRVFQQ